MSSSAYNNYSKGLNKDDTERKPPFENNYYQNSYNMQQAMYASTSVGNQHIDSLYTYQIPTNPGLWTKPSPGSSGVAPPSGVYPASQMSGHGPGYPPPQAEYYHHGMGFSPSYNGGPSMMTQPISNHNYLNNTGGMASSASYHHMPQTQTECDMSAWAFRQPGNHGGTAPGMDLIGAPPQTDMYHFYRQQKPVYEILDVPPQGIPLTGLSPTSSSSHFQMHHQQQVMGGELNGGMIPPSSTTHSYQQASLSASNQHQQGMNGFENQFHNLNIHNGYYGSTAEMYVPSQAPLSSNDMSCVSNGSGVPTNNGQFFSTVSSSISPVSTNNIVHSSAPSAILEVVSKPGPYLNNSNSSGSARHTNNSAICTKQSTSSPEAGGDLGPQKKTWATIASQPAKGSAASSQNPVFSHKKPAPSGFGGSCTTAPPTKSHKNSSGGGWADSSVKGNSKSSGASNNQSVFNGGTSSAYSSNGTVDLELLGKTINPKSFDLNPKDARFFVIKSYSEDDIHRSIKYSIWCSTEHGNKKLDSAFREMDKKAPVYLFFSVNGSGHFCGVARMTSPVDYDTRAGVWSQDKWKGQLHVQWIYVKDVPNNQLRHIRLESNENKPVTNSRDATEVPQDKGKQVLKVIHGFKHTTSLFDDFLHYERREEQETRTKHD